MTSPPATCHLLHLFSTFAAGGPQVRTATIVRALPEEFRHTIVALDGDFTCSARLKDHPHVAYADPPRKSRMGAYALRLGLLIRKVRPDLVLTYNWGAIEAIPGARLFGFRHLIHGEDGFGPDEAKGQLARRVRFRRCVLPLASRVVVPSRLLLEHAEKVWHVPERKRLHIQNGIDLDHFAPGRADELRREWRVGNDELVVGTVARLRAEKGLELLLEACAELARRPAAPRVRLVIVGDGPERGPLEARARALAIADRCHFAGPVADTRDALRAFDLFALSSHTEQMPISLIEAMACGRAAVSTEVGDVPSMVAAENRPFVVAGRDAGRFADALLTLLVDPGKRAALGAANRAKCLAEYRIETMVERYRALYRDVLAE